MAPTGATSPAPVGATIHFGGAIMAKYAPTFEWTPFETHRRAVCGMCPDVEITPTLPGVRAHLLAHRDHVVALVATTTTLLHIPHEDGEIAQVHVDIDPERFDRVSA